MAILLAITVLVLLYGHIEPTTPSIPDKTTNNSRNANTKLLSDEQREALREKYIAKMSIYENEIKPQIEELNLTAWSPESAVALQAQEKEAIRAFAENQFGIALTHLDELLAKVSTLQTLQQQNFQSALEKVQQAFSNEQIEDATSAINDALRYFPQNEQALLLKARITTMAAVAELVKAADVAHAENNLNEEISLLDQAIKLDPYRNALKERHQLLLEKRHQQKLDNLLQQASQAINDRELKKARALLAQIKQIDAKHPSLNTLASQIRQSEHSILYHNLLAKAKTAEQADNWQNAENYYQQALQIYSNNKDVDDRLMRATQINKYTRIAEQALTKPERLADDQIAQAMKQIIEESTESAKHSAQLQNLIGQLNDAITEMSMPVMVTVYSDEQTYVSVMGVGIIGKVKEYRLKEGLTPGRYLFKGERRGFKDKLVEVYIKPQQPAIVRIICDEPI